MENIFYSSIIYPLTQIIEFVFTFCRKLFENKGIALLGVSFAVSMLTLPLYIVAESWQNVEREKQAKMKKQIDRIKAAFKGNEQYMMLTTYYSQCHYHPIMGLRSAFGLLIQIPFFTAAYSCLSNMTALQGASFLFIKDLGLPDATFRIDKFAVNVLPIAMTLINIIASAIYLKGLPLREKLQTYGLAFLFLALLYNSPAGLVVYWTMNNVFSLVKNVFYKLKNPVKVLYWLSCAGATALICYTLFGNDISLKRGILVCAAFSLIYFAPLFVKFCNYLVDKPLSELRENSKKRLILFLFSCTAMTLILGMFLPSLLISSSPMEFSGIDGYGSPMFFVWNTFFQAFGLCFVWPLMIYFLFKERVQTLASAGFFVLAILSLVNILLFAGDYGILSKQLVFTDVPSVDSTAFSIVVNLFTLASVVAVLLVLSKFKMVKIYSYAAGFLCFGLLSVSIVNILKISSGYAEYEKITASGGDVNSLEPKFHFSKDKQNVLLIFLDRAMNDLVEPIFERCPELESQFSGFTLYKNTLSYNQHTLLGAPACYGGYEYTPESINARTDETLLDKQNQALLVLPRIFSENLNFKTAITEPSWANFSWVSDLSIFNPYPKIEAFHTQGKYLDLWYKAHKETSKFSVSSDVLKRNILWYGMFRCSPLVLRPAFYNDGKYWSTNTENLNYYDFLAPYSVLDYLGELTDYDKVADDEKGSFISITNSTTHEPMLVLPPEYIPVPGINEDELPSTEPYNIRDFHCMAASLKRLGEYFEELKRNGVYDNTRIILYSDHGGGGWAPEYIWNEKFDELRPNQFHPLLLVKDFGENGTLKVTDEFMTNADVPVMAVKGFEAADKNPFTGKEISESNAKSEKEKGALVCTSSMFMPYQTTSKTGFSVGNDEWWRVKENIFDPKNWVKEIQ